MGSSETRERAQQVFGKLQHMFESLKHNDLRPNTGAHNKLIKAWMKSGKLEAPQKTEDLLNEMMNKYKNGDQVVKPNDKTWVQVLKAHGEQPSVDSVEKLQSIARNGSIVPSHERKDYQPNTRRYNYSHQDY